MHVAVADGYRVCNTNMSYANGSLKLDLYRFVKTENDRRAKHLELAQNRGVSYLLGILTEWSMRSTVGSESETHYLPFGKYKQEQKGEDSACYDETDSDTRELLYHSCKPGIRRLLSSKGWFRTHWYRLSKTKQIDYNNSDRHECHLVVSLA